jgi:hypothetical protein
MPINGKNFRNKEINRLKNTVRGIGEQGKQSSDRRNHVNGVFSGGAYQLNRISGSKKSATMGGDGNSVSS